MGTWPCENVGLSAPTYVGQNPLPCCIFLENREIFPRPDHPFHPRMNRALAGRSSGQAPSPDRKTVCHRLGSWAAQPGSRCLARQGGVGGPNSPNGPRVSEGSPNLPAGGVRAPTRLGKFGADRGIFRAGWGGQDQAGHPSHYRYRHVIQNRAIYQPGPNSAYP